MNKKRESFIQITLLIALCFFWSGSAYLSWLYNLLNYYPPNQADFLSEVIGYFFQIIGLLIFAFLTKNNKFQSKKSFNIIIIIDFIFILLSNTSNIKMLILISGYLMNLYHGLTAGFYLMYLCRIQETKKKATAFGLGYGIGSIGTWLISLINSGTFLQNNNINFIYGLCIILTIFLIIKTEINITIKRKKYLDKKIIISAAVFVVLLSTVKNLGFYFPSNDINNANIKIEFTRAFYAFGLITAGLINDYKREYGAMFCLSVLFIPFVLLFLNKFNINSLYLWIISYIIFGFFSVYRIIIFCDLSDYDYAYLYLGSLGLLCGRLGDIIGSFTIIIAGNHDLLLLVIMSSLFFVTVFLFFYLYQKIYGNIVKDFDSQVEEFIILNNLIIRESEVLKLLLSTNSNSEIADKLYISTNTVKFHIKNILKKTGCTNRQELLSSIRKI